MAWIKNNVQSTTATSKWAGKKLNVLSDSASADAPSSGNNGRWPERLGAKLGLSTVRNYGIHNSRVSNTGNTTEPDPFLGGTNPMVNRVSAMDADADLVIVLAGGNDWVGVIPMGDLYTVVSGVRVPNSDDTTFYGALHSLCQQLIARYPDADQQIVLSTFIHSGGAFAEGSPYGGTYNIDDYNEAIRQIGKWYSIPVCDFFCISNMEPNQSAHEHYFKTDKMHFSDDGHEKTADVYANWLENN